MTEPTSPLDLDAPPMSDTYADLDNAQEITKAMTAKARELGWDVEWNWRDMDDGNWSYDVYLWRATAAETQTGGTDGS